MIATVHITTDLDKLMSCEAVKNAPPEILERFKQWLGDPVKVYLPALLHPTGTGQVCSSKYFWQIADDIFENQPGAACFCEHMLDID